MQVELTQINSSGVQVFIATCNKVTARIKVFPNAITICQFNARHQTKGMPGIGGRTFWSFADALSKYKSKEMQAIIKTVEWHLE